MRIMDRKTFLALPAGVLFSKYVPCIFGELCIKGDTWSNDFLVQDIAGALQSTGSADEVDKLNDALVNGTKLVMDFNCMGRDGMFDEDQLFAVWETDDVVGLIRRLGFLPQKENGPEGPSS